MKKLRPTEELALTNTCQVVPKLPITDEDLVVQAALEGSESFPKNAPKAPSLSKLATLFGRGPSGVAGDGG